jgi:hypothetical protein
VGDPLAKEKKILNSAALQKQGALDPVFLAEQSKWLITLAGWIIKGPPLKGEWGLASLMDMQPLKAVAGYLNYYKAHLTLLAIVLASIKKVEHIDKRINELKKNISSYIKQTSEVVTRIQREYPPSPWTNVKNGSLVILLAPVLTHDLKFVKEWNTYLDVYQTVMQLSSSVTEYLIDQGNNIERESPQKLAELRAEVERLKTTTSIDIILKYQYESLLDSIEFSIKTEVQSARSAATDAHKLVLKALNEVQKAQRL